MNDIVNKMKVQSQSPVFRKAMLVLGGVVVLLLVFQVGQFVGFRKASFSYRGGDNYYRAFGGDRGERGMMGGMQGMFREDFPGAHGAVGRVLSVGEESFIMDTPEGVERTVVMNNETSVMRFREKITRSELSIGDSVVVIGNPTEGAEITARLIRILPPPPEGMKVGAPSVFGITASVTPQQ